MRRRTRGSCPATALARGEHQRYASLRMASFGTAKGVRRRTTGRGLFVLLSALVWGVGAPLLRVGLVAADTLVARELLTVTFDFGLWSLVAPLLVAGLAWAGLAPRLWRLRLRWWIVPGSAFGLAMIAMLVGGTGSTGGLGSLVVTGFAVAVASLLLALALLPRGPRAARVN